MKHRALTLITIATTLAMNNATQAQTANNALNTQNSTDSQPQNIPIELEEILVTGTRLTSGIESEPISVIDAGEIERRGIVSMDQLLRQITSNAPTLSSSNPGGANGRIANSRGQGVRNLSGGSVADLRGLGAGSTLVLINGRRIAGDGFQNGDFADISAISIEAIDRVEVLTSGASAVYGADAVAGVINIILKNDYNGASLTVRVENSSSGGDLVRVASTLGRSWEGGNLTVSASLNDQKAVSAREFGVTTRDFRSRGGFDLRRLTSANGAFFANSFSARFLEPSDPFRTDAFVLPAGSGDVDVDTDINNLTRVSRDSLTELLPVNLTPEEQTIGLSARLSQEFDSSFISRVYVDALYTKRDTLTEVSVPQISLIRTDLSGTDFGIPFTDDFSFSGLRQDLSFVRSLADAVEAGLIPNNSFESEGEDYSLAVGIEGKLAQNWSWEMNTSFAQNKDIIRETGFSPIDVVFGVFDNDSFEVLSEPFNLLRSDFTTNPEAAGALLAGLDSLNIDSTTDLFSYQALVRGELFSGRDAGALEVAFGYQHRNEEIDSQTIFNTAFSSSSESVPIVNDRSVNSFFGEFSFPIVESLTVNGALRYETVDNVGNTVSAASSFAEFVRTGDDQFEPLNISEGYDQSTSGTSPRFGIAWNPNESLLLRATVGRSFRAPSSRELADPALTEATFDPVVDPQTDELVFDLPLVTAGNVDLEDERANTFNAGFTFFPSWWGNEVSLSVDWYSIRYKDRIGFSNPFGALFEGDNLTETDIVRDPSGQIAYLFNGPINTARENLSGVDVNLNFFKEAFGFDVSGDLTITKELSRKTKERDTDPFIDEKGIGQADFRLVGRTTLSRGDFNATVVLKHVDGYESDFSTIGDQPLQVDSLTTVDLQFAYTLPSRFSFAEGIKLKVGASNIFDTDPPETISFSGFDVNNYDNRRRVLYIEAGREF